MMPSLNWHDLDSFEPGAFYRQMESGKTVQFVGVASMPELDGEDVGVFRFVEGGRCLIATKRATTRERRLHQSPNTRNRTRPRRPNGAPLSKRTSHEAWRSCHPVPDTSPRSFRQRQRQLR